MSDSEMIDESLKRCIDREASRSSVLTMSASDTTELLKRVAERFGIDVTRVWWWESLPSAKTIDYTEGDSLVALDACVERMRTETIIVVVTDDEPPPWTALVGAWSDARRVVESLPFAELFVVDPLLTSIVFDTHLNRLVTGGRIATQAEHPGRGT